MKFSPAALRLLLIILLVSMAGCGDDPSLTHEGPPDLVVIMIDNLRADHLGSYGYDRDTSPNIDALVERGVRFAHAFSPSSWTRPAVASLFTSLYPSEHGAVTVTTPLPKDIPTLAERLRQAGYRTMGFSGNFAHVARSSGLARGFDEFESLAIDVPDDGPEWIWDERRSDGSIQKLRAPTAAELNALMLPRLPEAGPQPLFLYVHYMDPHAGYEPPDDLRKRFVTNPKFDQMALPATSDLVIALAAGRLQLKKRGRRRMIDLYDAEIAAVDRAIGELVDALSDRGFADRSILTVVSDHGEEFDEHGGWFHGVTLHRESVHVPLVMVDGRSKHDATVREDPVDLLDVAPTLLAQAGAASPNGWRGRNLLDPEGYSPRLLLAELHPDQTLETAVHERKHAWAVTHWPWRWMVDPSGKVQVFHALEDAAETKPLDSAAAEIPATVSFEINALRRNLKARAHSLPPEALDDAALNRLRSLGYAE